MILIDIEKAFDTVWHKGLIHKLYKTKMPIYLIKIIQHYLENRSFVISINDAVSENCNVAAGVPQGSTLGPILFLYYINDIPKTDKTKLALFADDTAIISSSWSKNNATRYAHNHLNIIKKFFYKWKIKINAAKTELIVFSKKIKEKTRPIIFENIVINPNIHAKYLGVTLDNHLTFTQRTNIIKRKCTIAQSSLYNLINRNSTLSTKNKLLLYKVVIRPIILYATPIWSNTYNSNIKKLETIENKIFTVSNKTIREKLKVEPLREKIKEFTKNFYTEKIKHLEILNDVAIYNHSNAPFKIKHKLPRHILFN